MERNARWQQWVDFFDAAGNAGECWVRAIRQNDPTCGRLPSSSTALLEARSASAGVTQNFFPTTIQIKGLVFEDFQKGFGGGRHGVPRRFDQDQVERE